SHSILLFSLVETGSFSSLSPKKCFDFAIGRLCHFGIDFLLNQFLSADASFFGFRLNELQSNQTLQRFVLYFVFLRTQLCPLLRTKGLQQFLLRDGLPAYGGNRISGARLRRCLAH